MPFQKGNEEHKKRTGKSTGRPKGLTKEKLKEREIAGNAFLEALLAEEKKHAKTLAGRYYSMAQEDPPTMRHAVDKVRANVKQELEISGGLSIGYNSNLPEDEE